jgi:phosphoribosylformylglycinamidine cyclo-ligase
MHRVFNCGIGMVVVVAEEHVGSAIELLGAAGERVTAIGRIEATQPGQAQTIVV